MRRKARPRAHAAREALLFSMEPIMEKKSNKQALRERLIAERLHLADRLERSEELQRVMRFWLMSRPDTVIGAY